MAVSSSSPIPPPQREYSVFLNFNGLDTRKSFISHLRVDLKRNGFDLFIDEKLKKAKSIEPGLFEAIENSSMSLVVFSTNYFESIWCLRELEKIMESKKNSQHIVLPIFHQIEPADIRYLNKSIEETLAKTLAEHEKVPKMENWRAILTEVANLNGIVSSHYSDEASFVEGIVKAVQGNLNSGIHLNLPSHDLVGIKPRSQELIKKLCLESFDGVLMIVIWGVGGLGKTTIAKVVYDRICRKFDGWNFVANVRETWEQSNRDLLTLQKQILSNFSENKNYNMGNSHVGTKFTKARDFSGGKVLLVLDDVDHVEQFNALPTRPGFFHPGSRIIVTTSNISSLNWVKLVLGIYEPERLNKEESLQLFNLHAFNKHNPPEGFIELSNTVVDYIEGIPLVLEVLGSFLKGKNHQSEWTSAITKLKEIPRDDVQRKLRIIFDSLDTKGQKLFLDIACFFVGESKKFTIKVLQDCEIFPEVGFQCLEDLRLLKCDPKLVIVMHDILKQMGKEIIRQESVDCPGERSRIWDCNDALQVLRNCEGTSKVEGLIVSPNNKYIKVNEEAFQKMKRLRILHLDHVQFDAENKDLFRDLVWLCWHRCGLNVLPPQLYLENLVALDLSNSNIKQVWRRVPKVLSKLKFLDLSDCYHLTTTPNFSWLPNLEELFLRNCVGLEEVDKSIGHLDKLVVLDLYNCLKLRQLPDIAYNLRDKLHLIY